MRALHLALTLGAMAAPLASAQAITFYAASTGDVVAYFAGSGAGYTETLGLNINGVSTGVEGLNNQTSSYGQSLVLGSANAGDVLTFYINVVNTEDTFYSDWTLNEDGVEHIVTSSFAGDGTIPAGTYVGFEDLYGGGDFNYHDLTFVFSNVTQISPVPEPAAWAMMVAGFGLAGTTLRSRRKATVRFA